MPRLATALLLLTFGLGASAQQPLPLTQADALGQQIFTASGSTGMVLVIVRGKEVFFRGYGETAPGSGQIPSQSSLLRLCSLSKIFATDLLFKLTTAGTVHLDDPLQRYAPPRTLVPGRDGRNITLADLATHTSGLSREAGRPPRSTPHFTFPSYAERWRWLPNQKLRSAPGSAALYSNVAFDLLGDALARATHDDYAHLLHTRTLAPLGMTETGFTPNPGQCARLLQTAHDEGPCTDTQNTAASSGLYSTATDVTVWLQYLLGVNTPTVPAQPIAAQAPYLQPTALRSQSGLEHAGKPTGIGLGWMHTSGSLDPAAPVDITEKTGGGAGFLTYIALDQARHTGLFLAVTDGPIETHLNVFKAANNLLLTLDGLPPLPIEPYRPSPKPTRRRSTRRKP